MNWIPLLVAPPVWLLSGVLIGAWVRHMPGPSRLRKVALLTGTLAVVTVGLAIPGVVRPAIVAARPWPSPDWTPPSERVEWFLTVTDLTSYCAGLVLVIAVVALLGVARSRAVLGRVKRGVRADTAR
ncbi:MAG: hypothetical protein M3Y71_05475 [Actinomycetota bacterium]|nr:hypothetical protein [Actinomycetota bacterium]